MTITIKSINERGDELGIPTGVGTVDFYIDSTVNGTFTIWLWSQGNVDLTQTLPQIQAALDANAAAYLAAAQNDVPYATGDNAINALYIANHSIWKKYFLRASFKLRDGIRAWNPSSPTAQADFAAVLQSVLNVITNNLPSVFTDEWTKERQAQGVNQVPSGMTQAQMRTLHLLVREWLNESMNMADAADNIEEWL